MTFWFDLSLRLSASKENSGAKMEKNLFLEAIEGEEAGTSDGAKKGWETRRANQKSASIKKGIANRKQRDAWSAHIDSLSKARRELRRSKSKTESEGQKGSFKFFGEECYRKAKK